MRVLPRILAIIGAICLLLLTYSLVRSPQGTGMALRFVGYWWLEPFSNRSATDNSAGDDIIRNPERERVAGLVVQPAFKILFQSEERVGLNGDGHSIVIAGPGDSREEFERITSGLKWNRFEPGIASYLSFLRETTPYSNASSEIDSILQDPEARYFLQDLKRNGNDITNMTIYIFSPAMQRILEWSSDF